MTNKGKVLAAVIAVVVVLAGGVGLYLKGGDLMGKIEISKLKTPVVKQVSVCTHQRFYSGGGSGEGSEYNFDSFFASVKSELKSNNGSLVCPLLFAVFSKDESVQGVVTCSGQEVYTYTTGAGEFVGCYKSGPHSSVTVSVYKGGGSFYNSFKTSDGNELAREGIAGPILYVDKLTVSSN